MRKQFLIILLICLIPAGMALTQSSTQPVQTVISARTVYAPTTTTTTTPVVTTTTEAPFDWDLLIAVAEVVDDYVEAVRPELVTVHAIVPPPTPAPPPPPPPTPVVLDTGGRDCYPQWDRDIATECLVYDIAVAWGIDTYSFGRVAECESKFTASAKNSRSSAAGVMQFLTVTWNWVSELGGPHPYGDRFNAVQNVENAAFLWTTQSPTHWSCY